MSSYGWQVFDAQGNLRFDHNVIMSRRLGWKDYPMQDGLINDRINGINFNGGTPFAYCVLLGNQSVPAQRVYCFLPPAIIIGSDYIEVKDETSNYPDDLGARVVRGGFTLNWGVYYG